MQRWLAAVTQGHSEVAGDAERDEGLPGMGRMAAVGSSEVGAPREAERADGDIAHGGEHMGMLPTWAKGRSWSKVTSRTWSERFSMCPWTRA